jgi:hypothetical protein
MSKTEISQFQRIIDKFRYGLVLQVIRNQLTRIGIEITPFYLEKEGLCISEVPEIKGLISEYSVGFLDEMDMKIIADKARGYSEAEFLTRMKEGKLCLGLKHNEEIAVFMWIFLHECEYGPIKTTLKSDEAYLTDMYTMESYRGRNLAAYLRYRSYEILKRLGRDKIYSVGEYFNTSAMKYKSKLNVKKLKLVLFLRLFYKFKWSFTIKSY